MSLTSHLCQTHISDRVKSECATMLNGKRLTRLVDRCTRCSHLCSVLLWITFSSFHRLNLQYKHFFQPTRQQHSSQVSLARVYVPPTMLPLQSSLTGPPRGYLNTVSRLYYCIHTTFSNQSDAHLQNCIVSFYFTTRQDFRIFVLYTHHSQSVAPAPSDKPKYSLVSSEVHSIHSSGDSQVLCDIPLSQNLCQLGITSSQQISKIFCIVQSSTTPTRRRAPRPVHEFRQVPLCLLELLPLNLSQVLTESSSLACCEGLHLQ